MRLRSLAILGAFLAGTTALAPTPAAAIPIPAGSNIDFSGGVHPRLGTDVFNAQGLDFLTSGALSPLIAGTLGLNNTTGGAFNGFNAFVCPAASAGGCGTIKDLTRWNPITQVMINPVLPILSFITFNQPGESATFDLTSFAYEQVLPSPTNLGTLTVHGTGIVHYAGFSDSLAIMTITAQGSGDTSFSGSVVTQGIAAPEPASMLMLGAGMIGLAAVSRRKQRTA